MVDDGRIAEQETPETMQSLWIGETIGPFGELSIASFLAHGHPFRLFCYQVPEDLPQGVEVSDAREILGEEKIFCDQGSYAHFADLFRWTLLAERGGWWTDLDVVCLRPLIGLGSCVFGREDEKRVCGTLMRFPARHPLPVEMATICSNPWRWLADDSFKGRWRKLRRRLMPWRSDLRWGEAGGPSGLTRALCRQGLLEDALDASIFYPLHYSDWRRAFDGQPPTLPEGAHALHLWNECTRREQGFDPRGPFPSTSLFEQLRRRYLEVEV